MLAICSSGILVSVPMLGSDMQLYEVFVAIQGKQHYVWRAVDQDGEVVHVFLWSELAGTLRRGLSSTGLWR